MSYSRIEGSPPRGIDIDPADMMKYNPLSKSSLQKFARNNETKMLYFGGHVYWVDQERSSMILIPGNDYEKIQSIKLHPANRPDKAYKGKDLEEVVRIYMIAYDAIGPAVQKRIDEGHAPYFSFVVWAKSGKVTAYESQYLKRQNGRYTYIRRSKLTGAEISTKDLDIQKRVEELTKEKLENQHAYQRPQIMKDTNTTKKT
ncbi:MAG: hypothetical protein KDK55_01440 [Chlamydiia bacterium]|nr:hypothetical protein [Chlamydiia bacterium]